MRHITFSVLFATVAVANASFFDNFDSGASPLWGNEVGGWTAAGGLYDAQAPGNFPAAHSSLPWDVSEFEAEFDMVNGSAIDGGLWFHSAAAPATAVGRTGYLLVLSGGHIYWHVVEDGSGYGSILAPQFNAYVGSPHVRVTSVAGVHSAYLNGSSDPVTTLTDSTFTHGRLALYDNHVQTRFDNFSTSVPEPGSLAILAAGALLAARRRR